MNPASYSLIRYNPDPGRSEFLNVGIVVWSATVWRLKLDQQAIDRVVRENPKLATDALRYLEPLLTEQLSAIGGLTNETFEEARQGFAFPVLFTEARYTTLSDDTETAIDKTLARLIKRAVTPKRRGGPRTFDPVQKFEQRFQNLILQKKLYANHFFAESKTGLTRHVDFFANSSTNVILDTLNLNVKKADTIQFKADAEAFKIEDILTKNVVRDVSVFVMLSDEQEIAAANTNAIKTIESVGAKIRWDMEEASDWLEKAITGVPH